MLDTLEINNYIDGLIAENIIIVGDDIIIRNIIA